MDSQTSQVRQNISTALFESKVHRCPGTTEGVYGIELLKLLEGNRLTCGFPVFAANCARNLCPVESDKEFSLRFGWDAPWLLHFPFKKYGMVVVGDAVGELARIKPIGPNAYRDFNVYDIFLLDGKKEGIAALGDHLLEYWGGTHMKVFRTANTISFYKPNHKLVQVLLCQFSTVGEILHSVDMGASAVLWDGEKLHMSRLGAIAMKYGANVLNLASRRDGYEDRIAEFFDRGFDLVVPGFDMSAVDPETHRISLPNLEVTFVNIGRNVIICDSMKRVGTAPQTTPRRGYTDLDCFSILKVLYQNLDAVHRGDPGALCASAVYTKGLNIFTVGVDFQDVGRFIPELFYDEPRVNVATLKLAFGKETALSIVNKVMDNGRLSKDELAAVMGDLVSMCAKTTCVIPFEILPTSANMFALSDTRADEWLGQYHC